MTITSLKNERLKQIAALRDKRDRMRLGLFLVEGAREIARAIAGGEEIVEFYAREGDLSQNETRLLEKTACPTMRVSPSAFAKLAMRDETEGLVAVFKARTRHLKDLTLKPGQLPLFVAIENPEKPGNLGAILRSADGAGAQAVIVLGKGIDLYNPNVIRSSLGTVFTVPTYTASVEAFTTHCQELGMRIVGAALTESARDLYEADFGEKIALLVGEESRGLSDEALVCCTDMVKIPMAGVADSLNVSVAAAIIMYEIGRRRR